MIGFFKSFYKWLTFPQMTHGACAFCEYKGMVIDLDDGDLICNRCWEYWPCVPRMMDTGTAAKTEVQAK